MFAGAAREAVFSNPTVIRRLSAGFIPVSVSAARMHTPPQDIEGRLLQASGRVAPAPQGIAVLNSDGQPLAWTLMFDSDSAVLDFLDYAKRRFREYGDSSRPFDTERYQRFPSLREPDTAYAGGFRTPATHPQGELCPGRSQHPKGTLQVQVIGRALDDRGQPGADTLHQSQYAQDQFEIPVQMQQPIIAALSGAEFGRIRVPDGFAQMLVFRAFLGQIDVRPLENPNGGHSKIAEYEFWVQRTSGKDGKSLLRLDGTSHLVTDAAPQGGLQHFRHSVKLTWEGFLEVEGNRITRLILSGEGTERLSWSAPQPPAGSLSEVAFLPAGRFINFDGKVRYGLIGKPTPGL